MTILHRDVFSALIVPKLFAFVFARDVAGWMYRQKINQQQPSIKAVSTMP